MKLNGFVVALVALVITCGTTHAANTWNLEMRVGTAFPLEDMGNLNIHQGIGLEATVAYCLTEHVGLYAGWGWQHFPTESEHGLESLDIEETGYRFGLQFVHPIAGTSLSYLISVGGVFNHIELEYSDDKIEDTGHGFGGEIGAGFIYHVHDNLGIKADIRYHYLPRDLTIEGTNKDLNLNYLTCGMSFLWSF